MAKSTRSKNTKRSDPSDEETPKVKKPRPAQAPRLSITITPELRKKIRIAAARADMEIGEWCKFIISEAAKRRVAKLYPDDEA